jgi:putative ABC transport system permease protein
VKPSGQRRRSASMFLRLLLRAALRQRQRTAAALAAMTVAAAAATAILLLFTDVQAKLQRQFRNYGANVIVAAKSGQLPPDALERIRRVLGGRGQAVPFAYVVARTSEDQAVVVAGTDLPGVRKQDTWWETTGWPVSAHDALIGAKAAGLVSASKPFELSFQQRKIVLNPAGILRTGSSEDSRIFIGLDEFQTWTGVPASTVEVAVSGPAAQINAVMHDIETAVPDAEVRPVRQLVEGETRILGKMRSTLLFAAIFIVITASLCVLATLTGWVLDHRRDFAVMKALGASNLTIHGFFAAEAAALGAGGGVIGFVGGTGIAAWISHSNFDTALSPRLLVFPPVLLGSIAIALLAAAVPMSLLGRIEPANILRGE